LCPPYIFIQQLIYIIDQGRSGDRDNPGLLSVPKELYKLGKKTSVEVKNHPGW
jgi:hypothetical protein